MKEARAATALAASEKAGREAAEARLAVSRVRAVEQRLEETQAALNEAWRASASPGKELNDLGLTLVPAPDFPGSKSKEGVAVSQVDPNSNAADQGLKRGDIIIEVQSKAVSTTDDVADGIREARDKGRKNVLLQSGSRDKQRFLALPIEGNSTTALPAR